MPQLERLSWLAPLSEGRGVTLSNDPDANLFLAENPDGLLIGVLLDSQYLTKKAFASPLYLSQRLGHLDMQRIAEEKFEVIQAAFRESPSLHRFPNKFAGLTQKLASFVSERYQGDSSRIWTDADNVDDLGVRLLELPAFGVEKTNWTVGMLGVLGRLPFDGWEDYRVPAKKPKRAAAES